MFKFESVSTCGSLKLSVEKTKTKVITETNQNKDLLRHRKIISGKSYIWAEDS